MHRAFALLLAAACAPKAPAAPPPPAPLSSARAPADVVRSAADVLTAAGFDLTTSDAAGGVLTAQRTRAAGGNDEYVTCRGSKSSVMATNRSSTITVAVGAAGRPGATTATVRTHVSTAYPGLQGSAAALPPSDTDCVSNGRIEERIRAAVVGT